MVYPYYTYHRKHTSEYRSLVPIYCERISCPPKLVSLIDLVSFDLSVLFYSARRVLKFYLLRKTAGKRVANFFFKKSVSAEPTSGHVVMMAM